MTKEQQEQLDTILRNGGLDLSNDAQTLRAAFNETMKYVPIAEDVEQHRTTIGGVDAIEVTIRGANSSNVVLYFHGGVYVIGSSAATVPLASELARRADARAITVDYRLAPEHPFPAALDDARAAYEGLLDQGFDPANIALAGESAGSGLAVATLLELRDAGLPLPSCAFLMSPYADLTLSGETLSTKRAVDPILTLVGLRLRVSEYVGAANAADPRISPIFGDLRVKVIDAEVERLLGGRVSFYSVADYLLTRSKGTMPLFIRTRHGHYCLLNEEIESSPKQGKIGRAHV